MPAKDQTCYVFIQLPGTLEWVVCGVLSVSDVGQNAYRGTFQYGRSYLARQNAASLDPYNLPLSDRPKEFTKLKGIPGALRDASPDAWGRRVIQAKLSLSVDDISEVDYLLNGPDDGAGNLRFGPSTKLPTASRPFNRTHQLQALTDATQELEETGKLAHEVLEQLEPAQAWAVHDPRCRSRTTTKFGWRSCPRKMTS